MNKNKHLGGWAIGENLFQWIYSNIPHGSKILEFGSGAGSHELARFYEMHCVEHSEVWLNKYPNINYYFAPIVDGWFDRDVIQHLPQDYALLLIDSPPAIIGRGGFIKVAHRFNMKPPVIVDDTHRMDDLALATSLSEQYGKKGLTIADTDKQFTILL